MEKANPASPKAYLIPYPITSFSQPILVETEPTYIGRSPDGDIQIQVNDRRISRKHARIYSENGRFFIEDLNSHNGTYLNKERITKAGLSSRDKIGLGNLIYQFLIQPDREQDVEAAPAADAPETITVSLEEMDLSAVWAQHADKATQGFLHRDEDEAADVPQLDPTAHQRLTLLYRLSENLRTADRTRDVYAQGIDLVLAAVPGAEYALVAKKSLPDDAYNVVAIHFRDRRQSDADAIPISRTVFDWVLEENVTLVSQDLGADQRFLDSESIRIHDLRSIICVPITGKQKVIGLLYAQANNLLSPFTRDDAKFVSAVANEMAMSIDNILLKRDMLRNARMAAIGLTVSTLAHNIKNLLAVNQTATQLMDCYINEKNYTNI